MTNQIISHDGLHSIAQSIIDKAFAEDEVLRNFALVESPTHFVRYGPLNELGDHSKVKEAGVYGEFMYADGGPDSESAKTCMTMLAERMVSRMRHACEPFANVGGRFMTTRNYMVPGGTCGIYSGVKVDDDGKIEIHLGCNGGVSENLPEPVLSL